MSGLAALMRHGQSVWNRENRFTGRQDVPLSPAGETQARAAAACLRARGILLDRVFVSALLRARQTAELMLAALGQAALPLHADAALNERDYGDLTGLNKKAAAEKFGAAQIHAWRRSFADAPPGGESLQDTAARVIPFYRAAILPRLQQGERLLLCAHGNSLRALIMHLEQLSPQAIGKVELATGEIWLYPVDEKGTPGAREILPV